MGGRVQVGLGGSEVVSLRILVNKAFGTKDFENPKFPLLRGRPTDDRLPRTRRVYQASGDPWCSGSFLISSSLGSARDVLALLSSFK